LSIDDADAAGAGDLTGVSTGELLDSTFVGLPRMIPISSSSLSSFCGEEWTACVGVGVAAGVEALSSFINRSTMTFFTPF